MAIPALLSPVRGLRGAHHHVVLCQGHRDTVARGTWPRRSGATPARPSPDGLGLLGRDLHKKGSNFLVGEEWSVLID